jgi:hypothetical protein
MSEPAKLNQEFAGELIRKPDRYLKDLKPGEAGNVYWNEMVLDTEYRCWIDPEAQIRESTLSMIRVTRTQEGFEVLIPPSTLAPLRWRLGAYNPADEEYTRYQPVLKIEYAKAEKRRPSTQENLAETEHNLAISQETNREIAELQKEIDQKLRKLRDKEDESPGG